MKITSAILNLLFSVNQSILDGFYVWSYTNENKILSSQKPSPGSSGITIQKDERNPNTVKFYTLYSFLRINGLQGFFSSEYFK